MHFVISLMSHIKEEEEEEAPFLPPELWGEIRSRLTTGLDKAALQRVCKSAYAAHQGPVCGALERAFSREMVANLVLVEPPPGPLSLRLLPDPWALARTHCRDLCTEMLGTLAVLDPILALSEDRIRTTIHVGPECDATVRVVIWYQARRWMGVLGLALIGSKRGWSCRQITEDWDFSESRFEFNKFRRAILHVPQIINRVVGLPNSHRRLMYDVRVIGMPYRMPITHNLTIIPGGVTVYVLDKEEEEEEEEEDRTATV
jgi:hypothetical protein